MSQIIGFSGKKQSGKNTLSSFLHAYQLKCYNIIQGFEISEQGELIIETPIRHENGRVEVGKGIMDVTRLDIEFAVWAMDNIWPFVKHYAFATPLKEIAIGLFDLDRKFVYGTDEEKNSIIGYKWEDMPTKIKGKSGPMTGREFMQYFGTDICRKIYPDIWTDRTIKDIKAEEPKLAVISDVRFENEVKAVQDAGGKVIRLTRSVDSEDVHASELALDKYEGFDAIIDNKNMSIEESCQELIKILDSWNWFASVTPLEPAKPSRKPSTMSIK